MQTIFSGEVSEHDWHIHAHIGIVWYWVKAVLLTWLVAYIAWHFVDLNVYIHTSPEDSSAVSFLLTLVGLGIFYILVSVTHRQLTGCTHEVAALWLKMRDLLRQ